MLTLAHRSRPRNGALPLQFVPTSGDPCVPLVPTSHCRPNRYLTRAALAVMLVVSGSSLTAQDFPLVVEGRGGIALPVASFSNGPDRGGEIGRAPTFGLHLVYRGPSGWGPYVGFSQHRFDCAADGCPASTGRSAQEYVATNWDVGMQRTLGNFGWVRTGFLFGRLERDFARVEGLLHRTSSLSVGVEGGLGLNVPIKGRVRLTPGIRYSWLNTRFRDDGLVRLRWLAADVGLVLGL